MKFFHSFVLLPLQLVDISNISLETVQVASILDVCWGAILIYTATYHSFVAIGIVTRAAHS